MKFNLIFEKVDVGHNGRCIAEVITDGFSYNYAKDRVTLSNRLLYPTHITRHLANCPVGAVGAFKFEHVERITVVDG